LVTFSVEAKNFPLDEAPLPRSMDDLKTIENTLIEQVPKVTPATVSIDIGGGAFGTGVIVSEDGLILTAAHVSQMIKKKVTVILNDGTELDAIALGVDSDVDSAMVKITEKGTYPYVQMDDGDEPNIGHWVFAMGHPGGFDKERGAVVRLGRVVRSEKTAFQSDCKLIGGDSGGPLFNMDGKLIAIHSRVGQTKENNMHVPLAFFRKNWIDLLDSQFLGNGPFTQPNFFDGSQLGVEVKVQEDEKLRVTNLLEGSVADKGGLKIDDVFLSVNEVPILRRQSLIEVLVDLKADEEIEEFPIKIMRKEKEIDLTISWKKEEES